MRMRRLKKGCIEEMWGEQVSSREKMKIDVAFESVKISVAMETRNWKGVVRVGSAREKNKTE